MKKTINFLMVTIVAITLFSCGKARYEKNIDGSWVMQKYTENGVDKTSDFKTVFPGYTIAFSNSSKTFVETSTPILITITVNGNYSFQNDNAQLRLNNTSPNTDVRNFNIVSLTTNEIELEETGNVNKHYFLVTK
jgi:hypothetical protein